MLSQYKLWKAITSNVNLVTYKNVNDIYIFFYFKGNSGLSFLMKCLKNKKKNVTDYSPCFGQVQCKPFSKNVHTSLSTVKNGSCSWRKTGNTLLAISRMHQNIGSKLCRLSNSWIGQTMAGRKKFEWWYDLEVHSNPLFLKKKKICN